MLKKRRTFLFGAGAELEWNAPTTSELTEIVLNGGFKMCDNETTITRFIHQVLLDNGYSHKEANFETIISVIEELVVHYSNFDFRRGVRSLHTCFFESKFHDEIRNFTIQGGNLKHGYSLEIPKDIKYNSSKISYQNETPEQFYFEQLLGELLTDITARIIEYSFTSKINYESDCSISFARWMSLHEKQSSLRLYTLNYDRLFKLLLQESDIEIFEGFNLDSNAIAHRLRPNVKKILSDIDGNIYYNLHGSINWDVEELDFHQLANAEIFYNSYPNLQVNNTPASIQVEGEKL